MRKAFLTSILMLCLCGIAHAEDARPEVGRFELTRTSERLLELLGLASDSDVFGVDSAITWQVYVPETYDPSKPAGLMVFISPTSKGWVPPKWLPVFEDHNMIWVSADRSGNTVRVKRRIMKALVAPYVLAKDYEIDSERVFVSGFSGGGKVASVASVNYATLFKGGVFIGGADDWSNVSDDTLEYARANRYVFITGSRDFNRMLTKRILNRFNEDGLANTKLINVSGMGHAIPDEENFREAVEFLDGVTVAEPTRPEASAATVQP